MENIFDPEKDMSANELNDFALFTNVMCEKTKAIEIHRNIV